MAREVSVNGKPFLSLSLSSPNAGDNSDDVGLSEYVCVVDWIKTFARSEAKWRSKPKPYTTTHVRASLDGQPDTVAFLEETFGVSLREMIT